MPRSTLEAHGRLNCPQEGGAVGVAIHLSTDGLTDAGAEAIAAAALKKAPQVQKLDLILDSNPQITDAGAQALFQAQALTPQLEVSLKEYSVGRSRKYSGADPVSWLCGCGIYPSG